MDTTPQAQVTVKLVDGIEHMGRSRRWLIDHRSGTLYLTRGLFAAMLRAEGIPTPAPPPGWISHLDCRDPSCARW